MSLLAKLSTTPFGDANRSYSPKNHLLKAKLMRSSVS